MEGHSGDRDSGQRDHIESGSESADAVRHSTLTVLESVLRQLVDRHGARTTAGELLAIYASMARLCKQDRVTIGEIADATGLSKQNVSRWAQKRIGDSIYLKINEDDQRMHDVAMLDRERGQESIEVLADLLGIREDGS